LRVVRLCGTPGRIAAYVGIFLEVLQLYGKAILVSDLKSANNKTFSSYLKVNANSGQLQYFQENPDIRRNTARRAAQADDTQNRQQEQKKGSRQAV
jgi:hypothetical protein